MDEKGQIIHRGPFSEGLLTCILTFETVWEVAEGSALALVMSCQQEIISFRY